MINELKHNAYKIIKAVNYHRINTFNIHVYNLYSTNKIMISLKIN